LVVEERETGEKQVEEEHVERDEGEEQEEEEQGTTADLLALRRFKALAGEWTRRAT
jgi:hypothetical protein